MTRLGYLLLFLSAPTASLADELFHTRTPVFACSEPHATWTSNRMAESHRTAATRPVGHCFVVSPGERWEKIAGRDGLLLLRRTPAMAGEPPLFFRAGDVARRADAATAPVPADTASPAGSTRARWLPPVPLLVAGLATAGLGGRWFSTRLGARGRRRRALQIARTEIAAQRQRLQIKRFQLVGTDDYGTVDLRKWQQEKGYFCKTRLLPMLSAAGLDGQWAGIERDVDRGIELAAAEPSAGAATQAGFVSDPQVFDARMDPIDYERHCAMLLRRAGWAARVTVASGDQGTDVLAKRNGKLLVVQCKLYRSAVGNAAVQQVSAARLHQRAQFAAVVSNARFTPAAKQLARTNGVHLLHHEELRNFQPT